MIPLDSLKTKVYVKRGGKYFRVSGPKDLLDSVKGIGGHILIGEGEFEIATGLFFSGKNSLTDTSINGFEISAMELVPVSEADKKELGI